MELEEAIESFMMDLHFLMFTSLVLEG